MSLSFQDALAEAKRLQGLEKYGIARTTNGYYYISHYYPLRAQSEVTADQAKEALYSIRDAPFETYIHFPFCEQLCTFCHFYKKTQGKHFHQKKQDVLDYIKKEIALYTELFGHRIRARSLQIGGGTPSLMSNEVLRQLLERRLIRF